MSSIGVIFFAARHAYLDIPMNHAIFGGLEKGIRYAAMGFARRMSGTDGNREGMAALK